MEFNFKNFIFLILASIMLSCSNDEDIDPNTTSDLSIAVAATTNRPIANTSLTFTLIATNNGPMDATDVIVENEIPSGYTFVNAEPSLGTFDEETGIWTIGDFENGETAILIIKVKVNETGEYNNKATISGEQTDIVKTNNNVTNSISIKPLTDDLLFTYEISEGANPEVTITGLSELWKDLSASSKYNLNIPVSIQGKTVTIIGDMAFENQNDILSVNIPNGVTTIGARAFEDCHSLTNVNIPDKVINIGFQAFSYCYNLKTLTIPNSKAKIEGQAFYGCTSLTSIVLPANLTAIKENVFYSCNSLENITIPNTVETIESGAFAYCTSLKTIALPNNLKSLENAVFEGCDVLTSFTVETNSYFSVKDGVLYDKNLQTLLNFPNGKSGSFSIPEGVTKIGESAFAYSNKLTSVTIASNVVTISNYAFLYCDALATVAITGNVKTIGQYAFGYNSSLTSVIINSVDPPAVTYRPFYNCSKLKLIDVPNASLDVYKKTTGWIDYKDILM